MTNDKSPTPAVEGTMGTCGKVYDGHAPHTKAKCRFPANWKPLAPPDSQGTKDKAQKFAEGAYALLSLGDHAKLPNTFVAVLSELYRNSVAAPSLNSVDTPAPVPERTNCPVCEAPNCPMAEHVAAPVHEPEESLDEFKTRRTKEIFEPPARKDELGTCHVFDTPHKEGGHDYVACVNWIPVTPQASPEHDLRKQDTPESKEHWDFVAEATARVEAMPEWKKNSVAVGGSPEAPAKDTRAFMADTLFGIYCSGNPTSIKPGIYWEGWQRVSDYVLARLGLSGRAE